MNCKQKCGKIAVLVVCGIAALGWVVMVLWNWLLPALFSGVHTIGYLQALALLLLSKILFSGLRCHGGWHDRWHHHRLAQLEKMTPEERERFQRGMGRFCCKPKE